MENLSPAALSTLKRELEKRVNSAMVKSKNARNRASLSNLVNDTEILNADEKKFKHELLTMFVDELKGDVRKNKPRFVNRPKSNKFGSLF